MKQCALRHSLIGFEVKEYVPSHSPGALLHVKQTTISIYCLQTIEIT